ncbi:MAG: DUF2807 domain-containing protein [Cyclobacteriaceae bacterium]
MKYRLFLVALGLAVAFVSIAQKETRSLSSFTSISVGEAIDAAIEAGSSEQVIVEVDGTSPENVITEVSGDELRIHMKQSLRGYNNVDVKVWVTYKTIDEIDVSSAASLMTNGPIKADRLEVDVSSAGSARLEVEVSELEVDISSAGNLKVVGTADEQDVEVSSSGDYEAFDLKSKMAIVEANSAGSVKVFVTEKIDAEANSGGSISYKGDPEKVYADSNSGGRVRRN